MAIAAVLWNGLGAGLAAGICAAVVIGSGIRRPRLWSVAVSLFVLLFHGAIAAMSGFEAAFEFGRKAAEAAGSAAEAAARRSAMATLDTAVAGMTRAVAALDPDFAASYAALKKSYGVDFPPEWSDPGDREEAWEVVQTNLKELTKKLDLRRQVLENGSRIDGPFFRGAR